MFADDPIGRTAALVVLALFSLTACVTTPPPAPTAARSTPGEIAPMLSAPNSLERPGRLVIIGGGLRQSQDDIYRAFLDARREGDLFVIPAASAEPAKTAVRTRNGLLRHGAQSDMVWIAPLALVDDESTTDFDESAWAINGTDELLAEQFEDAGGFWFTGGDQSRITALLTLKSGNDTPVLAAIRRAHAAGAPIAGSSAGAAMMSPTMITEGQSLPALHGPDDAAGQIAFADGLGFFPHGLIDQHFSERARLGRLAAALAKTDTISRGFGIDENTGLVVDASGLMTVVGSGYVTVLQKDNAAMARAGDGWVVRDLGVSLLSAGDSFRAQTGAIQPAAYKSPTIGREYSKTALSEGAGVAHPLETLPKLLGEGLLDNSGATENQRISFGTDGRGVRLRFRQTEASEGYWGRARDGGGRYLVHQVGLDISPVVVSVAEMNETRPDTAAATSAIAPAAGE